jgi:hypothetical protein
MARPQCVTHPLSNYKACFHASSNAPMQSILHHLTLLIIINILTNNLEFEKQFYKHSISVTNLWTKFFFKTLYVEYFSSPHVNRLCHFWLLNLGSFVCLHYAPLRSRAPPSSFTLIILLNNLNYIPLAITWSVEDLSNARYSDKQVIDIDERN